VQRALPLAVDLLRHEGIRRDSRVGVCYEHPEPVTTVLDHPWERVLFWPERDANPLFHFFEALFFLAGRNDVSWVARFNKRMLIYSDDGKTLAGSYGHRWRVAFGQDQIAHVEDILRKDPASRRAVLQMWHAPLDLGVDSKDICCNLLASLKIRDGRLLMTVFSRSHDVIWGALGSNTVTFSTLQEYLASRLGLAIGPYTQVSDSFHAYDGVWEKCWGLPVDQPCPYETGEVAASPLHADDPGWDADLADLFETPSGPGRYRTPWFETTVKPLFLANALRQAGAWAAAVEAAQECASTDWRWATVEWLQRRIARRTGAL